MEEDYKPKVLPEFKYYKGEDENACPFVHEDVRSIYWWGESMFAIIQDNERLFIEYKEDVAKWKESLMKHIPNKSARFLRENTDRQLAIAYYIVLLYGKWHPYGFSEEFIYEY